MDKPRVPLCSQNLTRSGLCAPICLTPSVWICPSPPAASQPVAFASNCHCRSVLLPADLRGCMSPDLGIGHLKAPTRTAASAFPHRADQVRAIALLNEGMASSSRRSCSFYHAPGVSTAYLWRAPVNECLTSRCFVAHGIVRGPRWGGQLQWAQQSSFEGHISASCACALALIQRAWSWVRVSVCYVHPWCQRYRPCAIPAS